MTKRAYLGIDIGSLTVKVILIDEQGRVIGRALADVSSIHPTQPTLFPVSVTEVAA